MWELDHKGSVPKNWCFWTVVLEKTLESPLDCKEAKPVHLKGNQSWIFIHWKDRFSSWSSNTLATWSEEVTHENRPWCWERLKTGREGDDRGQDGWMASPTQWTWVWASSRRQWSTEKPGMLQSMGSQRVGHDWATEQQWFKTSVFSYFLFYPSAISVLLILFSSIPQILLCCVTIFILFNILSYFLFNFFYNSYAI